MMVCGSLRYDNVSVVRNVTAWMLGWGCEAGMVLYGGSRLPSSRVGYTVAPHYNERQDSALFIWYSANFATAGQDLMRGPR